MIFVRYLMGHWRVLTQLVLVASSKPRQWLATEGWLRDEGFQRFLDYLHGDPREMEHCR